MYFTVCVRWFSYCMESMAVWKVNKSKEHFILCRKLVVKKTLVPVRPFKLKMLTEVVVPANINTSCSSALAFVLYHLS